MARLDMREFFQRLLKKAALLVSQQFSSKPNVVEPVLQEFPEPTYSDLEVLRLDSAGQLPAHQVFTEELVSQSRPRFNVQLQGASMVLPLQNLPLTVKLDGQPSTGAVGFVIDYANDSLNVTPISGDNNRLTGFTKVLEPGDFEDLFPGTNRFGYAIPWTKQAMAQPGRIDVTNKEGITISHLGSTGGLTVSGRHKSDPRLQKLMARVEKVTESKPTWCGPKAAAFAAITPGERSVLMETTKLPMVIDLTDDTRLVASQHQTASH